MALEAWAGRLLVGVALLSELRWGYRAKLTHYRAAAVEPIHVG